MQKNWEISTSSSEKNYRQTDEPTKEPGKFHRTLSQQADFEMNRLYLQDRLF